MTTSQPNALDADAVMLRPHGVGRYFEAAFLAVWLTGWIIGECVALAALASIVLAIIGLLPDSRLTSFGRSAATSGGGGFILIFLAIWLSGWTIGGIAAWRHLLRKIAGADRISVVGDGVELRRRAGPFRSTQHFDRSHLRRIRVRSHDKALVIDTTAGTRVLTDLGTMTERESLCSWLRDRLGVTAAPLDGSEAPPGWRLVRNESGAIGLMRPCTGRRTVAIIMWLLTAGVVYGWIHESSDSGAIASALTVIFILALAFASAWVSWAREQWTVRRGSLEHRLQFGPLLKTSTFEDGRLEVVRTTDSDGDSRYKLLVRDGADKRTFDSALNDDAELVDCARWLEAVTGFPLNPAG